MPYKPKYPIYIISKGRWISRLTSKCLEKIKVPYQIVIESSEYDMYSRYIDESKILVLPEDLRENPKWAISDDNGLIGGSIPARNWVWEHSISKGYKRHWILDDNIRDFYRLNRNKRVRVTNGTIFRLAEDFVDRFENVGQAGLNYFNFAQKEKEMPPYYTNTRIYSCILNNNEIDLRWRGKYNEDTDLSLRILKAGYCTILFNAFICDKIVTLSMKGGNTDNVYIDGDNRYRFAKSLYDQHPDVVKIIKRWNRYHHYVDYKKFKNTSKLQLKEEFKDIYLKGNNEHGLKLVKLKEREKKDARYKKNA